MNATHIELLRKLEQFQIDSPEATLPFSARLARENNWSPAYTRRVIAEYKRFAFLAVAAGHPVSHSENYWKVFCPQILGKPLHHQPTQGGPSEASKFDDWYARTVESYKTFFNEPPPADIWPSSETRRKTKHHFVRVDRARNWVVPKPRLRPIPAWAVWLGLIALPLLCGGAMFANGANVFDWQGPDFLGFYVILFAACFGAGLWIRRSQRLPIAGDTSQIPDLDGYATAYLNGGKVLAVNTAIANLTRQRALKIDVTGRSITSLTPKPEFAHDIERIVYAAGNSSDGNTIANVRESAKTFVARMAEELKAKGLVVEDRAAERAIILPLLLALGAITIGVIKVVVGYNRDKPVGFLFALCIISLVVALVAFGRRPLRSRLGDAVLEKLQNRHIGSRQLGRGLANLPSVEFAMMLGLFGMDTLAGTELQDLKKSLQPTADTGCGGGCSSCGGGCGGGCGGCGGD